MKKLLVVMLVAGTTLLSGCNMQVVDTTWNFDEAYIKVSHDETIHCKVSSWKDFENSDAVQVKCTDGTTYLGHYQSITLIKN